MKFGETIMVTIDWCKKKPLGIRIIEPNSNMASSYVGMAAESIDALSEIGKSRIWTATTSYYVFYYSLYALMLRIGIKCEIHSCSLEFMEKMLGDFYSKDDNEMIRKSFKARIDLQYYADREVERKIIDDCRRYCKDFFIKTKDILSVITEKDIDSVRARIKG